MDLALPLLLVPNRILPTLAVSEVIRFRKDCDSVDMAELITVSLIVESWSLLPCSNTLDLAICKGRMPKKQAQDVQCCDESAKPSKYSHLLELCEALRMSLKVEPDPEDRLFRVFGIRKG
jgi:hypothetical protein